MTFSGLVLHTTSVLFRESFIGSSPGRAWGNLKIEFEKFIIIQQWFLNMNFIGIISANFKQQLLLIEIKENMNIHHLQFCYNYIYMLQPM
jgi:hypothetical protein